MSPSRASSIGRSVRRSVPARSHAAGFGCAKRGTSSVLTAGQGPLSWPLGPPAQLGFPEAARRLHDASPLPCSAWHNADHDFACRAIGKTGAKPGRGTRPECQRIHRGDPSRRAQARNAYHASPVPPDHGGRQRRGTEDRPGSHSGGRSRGRRGPSARHEPGQTARLATPTRRTRAALHPEHFATAVG